MTVTDEPGIYEEGKLGVRIENELLCVPVCETEYGAFYGFEPFTYCPIDTRPLKLELMTREELEWLDRYHAAVLRELGAYLNKEEGAWLEKACAPGGTMNVCIAVLLCFALLGALDEGSGGRLGVLLFCWMTWGLFVPEWSVMPPDVVEEVLVIILKITIIVCGSLVAGRLVLAKCSRWLEWAASRLGVNEYAVLGLLTSLVSSVSMLPLYPGWMPEGE